MSAFEIPQKILRRIIRGKNSPTSNPTLQPFETYLKITQQLGIKNPHLFLSFDCDTDLDAVAAEEVHIFLESLGIKATYAVPGAQLLKSPKPYQRLARRGAEFMNHGGSPHAEWSVDQWVGTTFYDAMSPEEVEADIRRGHQIVVDVIGQAPKGFRAPHFGCYQKPDQVDLMHRVASNLGYEYCSTTIPAFGLKYGPIYETQGLIEAPCFGSFRNPESILDSWTYLTDKKNYALGDHYQELMIETMDAFIDRPVLFTWYADPCHVLNQAPFMLAMEHLAKSGVVSISGVELASITKKQVFQM
jgi:peptidoglycan/xylan/chitin deacetylase (PgdA/CDA1 family)